MKTKEHIVARIEELRKEQKEAKDERAAYRSRMGIHKTNFRMPEIKERDGKISGLLWVLEGTESSTDMITQQLGDPAASGDTIRKSPSDLDIMNSTTVTTSWMDSR